MRKVKKLLLFAAALMLASCGGGSLKMGDNKFPVETVKTQEASLETTYPATIKGIQDVQILPKVSGFITEVRVQEGQTVSAGQVLFVIDNETYQAAVRQCQASVNTAKAQLATSKLTYENNRQLFEKNVIGQYELSTAENSYATAQANLAQAEAALASAKETLSYCYVTSPASGVVGDLPYKKGALVSASGVQPLTTVSDISTMEVYFSMTEKDVLSLTKNAGNISNAIAEYPPVKLQLADGSVYEHEGKVVKVSGVIDSATGSVSMIARFPNPDKLLKSGGAGQIVVSQNSASAIVVPQDATSQVQDKVFIYVVGEGNKVVYTEIKVNPQTDGNNYIVTDGLKEGDRYVVKGVTKLSDGMEIEPISLEEYQKSLDDATELSKSQNSASGMVKALQK